MLVSQVPGLVNIESILMFFPSSLILAREFMSHPEAVIEFSEPNTAAFGTSALALRALYHLALTMLALGDGGGPPGGCFTAAFILCILSSFFSLREDSVYAGWKRGSVESGGRLEPR